MVGFRNQKNANVLALFTNQVKLRSYQDEPAGAEPSWPAAAARGCQGTSAEPPGPQHDPGSPQTPRGGRHSLETQRQERYSATAHKHIAKC